MIHFRSFSAALLCFILFVGCSATEEFHVLHQVTGGIETNCYLLYGVQSREAALIDVAGPIDSLQDFIRGNNLDVKYFLFTHGHFDHLIGLPDIRSVYPDAKVCIHKSDYGDMFTQKEWAKKNMGQEIIDYLLSDPERREIYEFRPESFGLPDIYIEDNQLFELGKSQIRAIHAPGHSPGSVCYYIDTMLFSGDVLFYRSVGRVDVQNSSREEQIKSVRRLYETLPDHTKVYPGHGKFTDIGSEKEQNERITINEVYL